MSDIATAIVFTVVVTPIAILWEDLTDIFWDYKILFDEWWDDNFH